MSCRHRKSWPRRRPDMEREFIKQIAGPLAEARYRRRSLKEAFCFRGSDERVCNACVALFSQTTADRKHLWRELEARARRVVAHNWPSIEAVADALIERRRLSYRQTLAIVSQSGGAIANES
jgi:hypothetical protein